MGLAQRIFINRNYGLLFIGRLVSQIGDGIHYLAITWLVLDLTGSAATLGTLLMASSLPGIVLTPFSGVLADRLDRKKIIVSMDIVRGLVTLILGVIYFYDGLTIPVLFFATVLISLSSVLFNPAISASIPSLVKKDELVKANARDSLSQSATGILGPIVGAILLGKYGYFAIFMINGTSFILSAISEMFIRFPVRTTTKNVGSKTHVAQFKQDFIHGLAYVWQNKGLRTVIMYAIGINFLYNPIFSVVLPYFGKEVLQLDAQFYGYVQSSFPAGLLLGTLLVGMLTSKYSKPKLLAGSICIEGFIVCGLGILALPSIYQGLASTTTLLAMVLPIFFMGIFNVQINVPFTTMLQETVPDALRGRVFGLLNSMSQILVPISTAMAGFMIDGVPVASFLLISGILVTLMGISINLSPTIGRMYNNSAMGEIREEESLAV